MRTACEFIKGKPMTRDEFCNHYWEYYLLLENEFVNTNRYIAFDLGDNNLYVESGEIIDVNLYGNSLVFSDEYVKQYQSICAEIDTVSKAICCEFFESEARSMPKYTKFILEQWPALPEQKVEFASTILQPFKDWKSIGGDNTKLEFSGLEWWRDYTDVKHNRIENYRKANLKNVVNSLAGLYTLELYLVRYIGMRDDEEDVPNDISKIFHLIDFHTESNVVGRNTYTLSRRDLDKIFNSIEQTSESIRSKEPAPPGSVLEAIRKKAGEHN